MDEDSRELFEENIIANVESQLTVASNENQKCDGTVAQPSSVFDIQESNLSGASIGATNYNLQKQDFTGADLKGAHFGTRIINKTYITKQSAEQGNNDSDKDRDYADLSDTLRVYKKDPICERASIYRGEQVSTVTGSRPIAVKFLPYNNENIKEAKILLKLACHPNVVSIIHSDVYNEGPFSKRMYIAMELCHEQDLGNWIKEHRVSKKPFQEPVRLSMAKELIDGLAFIHSKNVIHRDLKPSNVLLTHDKSHVKITDFGLSKELRHGCSVTAQSIVRAGTDGFRAPETYLSDIISQHADIFSLGLVIYFLWSNGCHPFGNEPDLWNYNIKMNRNLSLRGVLISHKKKATDLLSQMLKFEAHQRPTADELKMQPFFKCAVEFPAQDESLLIYDGNTKQLHLYSPLTKQWKQIKTSLTDIKSEWFSLVALGGYAYILVGCTRKMFRLKYHDTTSKLEGMADMLEDHGFCPPAATLDDSIYICGGNFPAIACAAEKYESKTNTWTVIQNLPFARSHGILASAKGKIYCVGGKDMAKNILNSAQKFDRKHNAWHEIKPLLWKTCLGSAVEVGGNLYISDDIGVQVYDTSNKTWSVLDIMTDWPFKATRFLKSVVVNNELFLIGKTQTRGKTKVYKLDLNSRQLTLVDELVTGTQLILRAWIVAVK